MACAANAVIYQYNRPSLEKKAELFHPDSRKKDVDLMSDREGEYRSTAGGHGNFVEASGITIEYEAKVFALEVAKKLKHENSTHQFDKLILIAEPHFMGLLRQSMQSHPIKDIPIHKNAKRLFQRKAARVNQIARAYQILVLPFVDDFD